MSLNVTYALVIKANGMGKSRIVAGDRAFYHAAPNLWKQLREDVRMF